MEKSNRDDSSTKSNIKPLIDKLKKLFEYYCLYGEKLNSNILKSHKFIKLAEECRLIDKQLNKTRLELIYKAENKYNRMNFNEFLNSLIKISGWKYSGENNKTKALNMLILNYLLPRHDEIFNIINLNSNLIAENKNELASEENLNSDNGNNGKETNGQSVNPIHAQTMNKSVIITVPNIDDNIFDKNVEEIFIYVAPILFDIYKIYFPEEVSLSENFEFVKEKSMRNYYIWLRDFNLYPGLISKPSAFQIYQSEENESSYMNISKNKEHYFKLIKNIDMNSILKYNPKNGNILGQHFNFFKFLRVILKISDAGYEKLEKAREQNLGSSINNLITRGKGNMSVTNLTNYSFIPIHEKLMMTLERMELSEGFINLERKTSKTHSIKNVSIISENLLEKIKSNNSGNLNSFIFENHNFSTSNILAGISTEDKTKCLLYVNNYQNICEYTNYIMDTYGNELNYIFKGFCSFGDHLNTQFMTSKIFTKMLKVANLIKINQRDNFKFLMARENLIIDNSEVSNINLLNKELNNSCNKKQIGLKINEIDSIFIKLTALVNLNYNSEVTSNIQTIQGTNNITNMR